MDDTLIRLLNDLSEQLFAFVACGVRSSFDTEVECVGSLQRLGFELQLPPEQYKILPSLAELSILAIVGMSLFIAFITRLGLDPLLEAVRDAPWGDPFQMPKGIGLFFWTLATAVYYFAAIMGALMVRGVRVSKRNWFNINDPEGRSIPWEKYATPALAGTLMGGIALFVISLFSDPTSEDFFRNPLHDPSKAVADAIRSLIWLPLAFLMAPIALLLIDADTSKNQHPLRMFLVRSLGAGILMGLSGAVLSFLSKDAQIQTVSARLKSPPPTDVSMAEIYISIYVALLIGVFVCVLCLIVQFGAFRFGKGRRLVGRYMQADSPQCPSFTLRLEESGGALRFGPGAKEFMNPLSKGQWIQFPEGTRVQWTVNKGCESRHCDDVGLITFSGESVIYEEYKGKISGKAEFVARLALKL